MCLEQHCLSVWRDSKLPARKTVSQYVCIMSIFPYVSNEPYKTSVSLLQNDPICYLESVVHERTLSRYMTLIRVPKVHG